jgi:AcrR family transcriptional regulator
MDRNPIPVNSKRRYDSSRRREQALRTREAVLDVAQRLFLTAGYAATTVASIARAANVSVETIYKGLGGKPGLVRAIWDRGLAGEGPVPAETRSDEMRSTEADPRRVFEAWGTLTAEVAPRVAPILLLIRNAAATDPDMASLLEEVNHARLTRMEHNVRDLHERGDLREEVTFEEARDVLWVYSSPELYELLVSRRGWAVERYGRFVAEGMAAALLPPAPIMRTAPGGASAAPARPA